METIKWQTRAAYGCMAARRQACVCGISLQPIGCTPALSVTQSTAASAVHGLWRYISVGPLPFYLYSTAWQIPVTRVILRLCSGKSIAHRSAPNATDASGSSLRHLIDLHICSSIIVWLLICYTSICISLSKQWTTNNNNSIMMKQLFISRDVKR